MKGVYLIHFETPYTSANGAKTVQHYLGWASDIAARLRKHRAGNGARLMSVVAAAGIEWRCVRRWKGASRTDERRLKNWHKSRQLCPVCCKTAATVSTCTLST